MSFLNDNAHRSAGWRDISLWIYAEMLPGVQRVSHCYESTDQRMGQLEIAVRIMISVIHHHLNDWPPFNVHVKVFFSKTYFMLFSSAGFRANVWDATCESQKRYDIYR